MRIANIKVYEDLDEKTLFYKICHKQRINPEKVKSWRIYKKSIDARNKENVHYNYTVDFFMEGETTEEEKAEDLCLGIEKFKEQWDKRVVVIGAGPAGLFATYTLALNGVKPILLEQGSCVEERQKVVQEFLQSGKLNPHTNVQFGEGGAGTFSDGKLTTGVNQPLNRAVLETFVQFGAPKQILYDNKPHIGTDELVKVLQNMRKKMIALGAEIRFHTKVVDFEWKNQSVEAVWLENGEKILCHDVILAIGHSARDTFETLFAKKVKMEPKNFAVGVRIEHLQEQINKAQYGNKTQLKLPPAEYKLVYHAPNGRSCYTFCMCPGGMVIASSSEPKMVVTNGMSRFLRDGQNANSALLVNVTPEDFRGYGAYQKVNSVSEEIHPLSGMYFQRDLEHKAFLLGGENYFAPIQKVGDFMQGVPTTKIGKVIPSYQPGVTFSDLNKLLPDFVAKTLKEGILYFDKKIKGFADCDAILTGVETRSSSPVRIVRDEYLESNYKGLYPCGEGAGYAGGIMTAAMDGIKVAKQIMKKYC